jgi:hypothetical protein
MSLVTRRAIVTSATLTALIVIAFGFFLYQMFVKVCGNEILSEFVSPDSSKKIVVFQRDCGATTPFSTQASLFAITEKLPDEGGNVFSADTNHGAAPSGPGGGPELRVRWETRDRLILEHHKAARIFKAARHIGQVEVHYETFR